MQDVNTCHVSPVSGNIITPKGKLFFAQYSYTPQKDDAGKDRYSLQLCFKPDVADKGLVMLKNELGKIALEALDGDKARAKTFVNNRFTDPNNRQKGGKPAGPEYEGWTLLSCASKQMPDFVLPNGQKVDPAQLSNECYSGRWARATVRPYWLSKGKYPGLYLGLVNVQLLDHDDPIGFTKAQGEEEFGAVEGAGTVTGDSSVESTVSGGSTIDSLF